jgi:hypothetical protein
MNKSDFKLDCGSNSCMFAAKKGGMRTNGPCTCLEDITGSRSTLQSLQIIVPEFLRLKDENAELKKKLDQAVRFAADEILTRFP